MSARGRETAMTLEFDDHTADLITRALATRPDPP
jgi:hypothetical protein